MQPTNEGKESCGPFPQGSFALLYLQYQQSYTKNLSRCLPSPHEPKPALSTGRAMCWVSEATISEGNSLP